MESSSFDWHLSWGGLLGGYGPWVGAFCALVLVAFAAREMRARPVAQAIGFGLLALRVLTACAVMTLISVPTLQLIRNKEVQGGLSIVVDDSASMQLPASGDATRAALVQKQLGIWSQELSTQNGQHGIEVHLLDGTSVPLTGATGVQATRASTSFRDSLKRELDGAAARGLGSVLLISDGVDNASKVLSLSNDSVPVHTALLGDPDLIDLSLTAVSVPPRAFLHEAVSAQITARGNGVGSGPFAIRVLLDEEEVARAEVELDAAGVGRQTVMFEPRRLGRAIVRIELAVPGEDHIAANNVRSRVVDVRRSRYRILHVSGQPSWDSRFLRTFLKSRSSVDLVSFFILRNTEDDTGASQDELALIPFPTDELFREHLASFDLVVFQNFDYAPYGVEQYLPAIASYVRSGGGFVMLGGTHSFAAGGYAGTPLAEVIPLRFGPSGSESFVEGDFSVAVSADALAHPVIDLESDRTSLAASISALRPLSGINRTDALAGGAVVLLRHPQVRSDDGTQLPVVAVADVGRGRSMAVATDSLWHWSMPSDASLDRKSNVYERFWDQSLRWLTHDPSVDASRMDFEPQVASRGQTVRVTGVARDSMYRVAAGSLVLKLDTPSAAATFVPVTVDAMGRFSTTIAAPGQAGTFTVTLLAQDTPLVSSRLVVEGGGEEYARPWPDAAAMKKIAERTGGRFWSDASALSLTDIPRTKTVEEYTMLYSPLSDWRWIVGMIALFLTEWTLRRRLGLR